MLVDGSGGDEGEPDRRARHDAATAPSVVEPQGLRVGASDGLRFLAKRVTASRFRPSSLRAHTPD